MNRILLRFAPFSLLFFAVLLASCGRPITADTDPERAERYAAYFGAADTDQNSVLEQAEIDAVLSTMFGTMDYNNDGSITLEDVNNPDQGAPEGTTTSTNLSHHLPYDANADGTITPDEHRAYLHASVIGKIDTNRDGQLTLAEYRAFNNF